MATQVDLPTALIIGATLLGPVLAVQAQKWVEKLNERKNRKQRLFEKLMATRGTRLSVEHVQALNMIETVFYGTHVLGIHRRSKEEQSVLNAWREYLDHLNTPAANFPGGGDAWTNSSVELFTNILAAMAAELRYSFDRVTLKKGWYIPNAHGEAEADIIQVRKLAKQVLGGEKPIKMAVTEFPVNEEFVQAQKTLAEKAAAALESQKAMGEAVVDAISGKSAVKVKIDKE